MIISFADASTEPYAVVVKLQNTIIACIAMGSSRRSKYITCFTIFEFEKLVLLHIQSMIEDLL